MRACLQAFQGQYRETITKGMGQLITVFIIMYIHNLQQVVAPEKLIGVQGQASYMSMLSYGIEGKAIIIAFLWLAKILVVSKQ